MVTLNGRRELGVGVGDGCTFETIVERRPQSVASERACIKMACQELCKRTFKNKEPGRVNESGPLASWETRLMGVAVRLFASASVTNRLLVLFKRLS